MDEMIERIKQLIGEKQGAIKELAEEIGVCPNTITNWKGGQSTSYFKYAPKIAQFYGVSLDWLFGVPGAQKYKPAADKGNELDIDMELSKLLRELEPDQVQRVRDFVHGIISSR